MSIDDAVAAFSETYGVLFRPASPTEIAAAESAGVPDSLLEFFREYEVTDSSKGRIRCFSLEKLVAEMTDFVPSCHLSPLGYFAIGGTEYGDVYCVRPRGISDYRKMPVYLFSHEIDLSKVAPSQIEEFGTVVAVGIPDFLAKAAAKTLEIEPS